MLTVENIAVKRGRNRALHNISFTLPAGKTLAVVGESGAGKSTLIAAILGFLKPTEGQITWSGRPVRSCLPALVMQEPRAAFNPVLPLRRSVLEPVVAAGQPVPDARIKRLCDGLEIKEEILERRPNEVSIGQAQRVGILRALIAAPPLVLFDEPLSALDAVTQKHTARLIRDLQAEEGFAALIVTHDLGYAVAHSDEIAVLRAGQIEEISTPQQFVTEPKVGYCQALRDAAIALGGLEAAA
ncbi:ABC transporter ATP-binding protein [Epibacterium ulvae]|uniref:ABC transporter ATP-binding protein n=1 Tax=Epibacterium ulvae TaxID=1156985 RepID=UPI002490180C|nr:dipeptide/oligopeptide/nickel ABC transporter ATP-binding protein [Epibacterium ulvae]